MKNEDILANLHAVQARIKAACAYSNRDPDGVKLLLATKTVSADRIAIALHTGNMLIAENKVQELREKYEALKTIPHTSHFIGHLQTNKIKEILRSDVACVQSVDRLELAEKLDQRLAYEHKNIGILVQVNTSGEKSKFGVRPEDAVELVGQIARLRHVKIKGLMTIGLFSKDTAKVRACFRLLKDIQQNIIRAGFENVQMDELSMGMSGDLEIAIEEGATIVRVGSAVFGARKTPDSFYWNESPT